MKKTVSVFLVFVFLLFGLWAKDFSSYVTLSYNYGLFTERGNKTVNSTMINASNGKTRIKSNGIDLSVSGYGSKNFGFYLNTGYYFPYEMESIFSGTKYTVSKSTWDKSIIISAILGPSYRYKFNDQLEIYGALGMHYALFNFDSDAIGMINSSIGIGGDIGIRYLPTNYFYVTLGSLFSHDFYCWNEIDSYGGRYKDHDSYNFGGFRPYIGIGFSFKETIE